MSSDYFGILARNYFREQEKKRLLAEDKKLLDEEIQRRVFYSFHYENECRIAAQIRNIGSVTMERKPVYDNDWEKVPKNETSIARWISNQMEGRTCTIVLIGVETANRYWVQREIIESWNKGMGVVGIHTHNLNDPNGSIFRPRWQGANPFETIHVGGQTLSNIARTFDPPGTPDTPQAYNWIADNLNKMVEDAIRIRKNFS